MNTLPDLYQFFRPKSIAVVGASNHVHSIGGKPIFNLKKHNYEGNIYPINPNYSEVQGYECYPSLLEVPGDIDLALILVSKKLILNVIEECKKKQVKYLIIFGSGFAETGEEGKELQEKVIRACHEAGIRVVGPNVIGSINVLDSIPLGFSNTFVLDHLKGNVGMVSQSGALGYAVFAVAQAEGIGFSYVAHTGNQADLNVLDFLEFLAEDKDTNVVVAYMEAYPDEQRFKRIAEKAAENKKPLVILKAGRSDLGKVAARYHTASEAGSMETFQSLVSQYGVTIVKDNDDLVESMKIFSRGKRMKGGKVAVISSSGATGILMADNCHDIGLEMANLSEETTAQLKGILPDFASTLNPVDVTAQALNDINIFNKCLKIVLEDDEVDALAITTTFADDVALKIMEEVIRADKEYDKPIIVNVTGPVSLVGKTENLLQENGVPTFQSTSKTAIALKRLYDYSQFAEGKN